MYCSSDTPTDEAFQNLADEYISDLTNFSPVFATMVGDHSADGELDNVDDDARKETLSLYREYKAALTALDRNELSRANQVDAELLLHEVESSIWSIETLQEWAWNPLYYVDRSGSAIYALMARDFAPIEQRLLAATSRLEQLPRFLEQARGSIEPDRVPKIHAETAIKQNPGLSSIIEAMIVPNMDALPTAQQARLNAAIETAKDALANHQTWLEEELLPRANGDFRIGAELYDVKLAFALNSPLSRKEITARAEQEYEAVRNKMYEVAKEAQQDVRGREGSLRRPTSVHSFSRHPRRILQAGDHSGRSRRGLPKTSAAGWNRRNCETVPAAGKRFCRRAQPRHDARGARQNNYHARVSARRSCRVPRPAGAVRQGSARILCHSPVA
jgi:uncharacterized protein (DUF885 family)